MKTPNELLDSLFRRDRLSGQKAPPEKIPGVEADCQACYGWYHGPDDPGGSVSPQERAMWLAEASRTKRKRRVPFHIDRLRMRDGKLQHFTSTVSAVTPWQAVLIAAGEELGPPHLRTIHERGIAMASWCVPSRAATAASAGEEDPRGANFGEASPAEMDYSPVDISARSLGYIKKNGEHKEIEALYLEIVHPYDAELLEASGIEVEHHYGCTCRISHHFDTRADAPQQPSAG